MERIERGLHYHRGWARAENVLCDVRLPTEVLHAEQVDGSSTGELDYVVRREYNVRFTLGSGAGTRAVRGVVPGTLSQLTGDVTADTTGTVTGCVAQGLTSDVIGKMNGCLTGDMVAEDAPYEARGAADVQGKQCRGQEPGPSPLP